MSETKRAHARRRGLAVAAKIAGASGIAIAALGVAQAASAELQRPAPAADERAPLPLQDFGKSQTGSCGCSPCWGPPAPPRRSRRRAKRTA